MARGNLRERTIVRSVSVPPPFRPNMDWRRIRIERKGGTLTLPKVMETRITRMRSRPSKIEITMTFFRVMIFIKESLNNDQ
jgi:hypothetical protein